MWYVWCVHTCGVWATNICVQHGVCGEAQRGQSAGYPRIACSVVCVVWCVHACGVWATIYVCSMVCVWCVVSRVQYGVCGVVCSRMYCTVQGTFVQHGVYGAMYGTVETRYKDKR